MTFSLSARASAGDDLDGIPFATPVPTGLKRAQELVIIGKMVEVLLTERTLNPTQLAERIGISRTKAYVLVNTPAFHALYWDNLQAELATRVGGALAYLLSRIEDKKASPAERTQVSKWLIDRYLTCCARFKEAEKAERDPAGLSEDMKAHLEGVVAKGPKALPA